MSLAQYRASIKIVGEKSALFQHKKEIFEAIGMGLSHKQIHHFLTTQKGLKVSRQALSAWLKKHKNKTQKSITSTFSPQKIEVKNQANNGAQDKKEPVSQPKVEPKEALILTNDDDFYAHLRKVADKRAKWLGTNPYITQETQDEDSSM